MQDLLNFSYTVNHPPDGQWGSLQSNGTWNGMINELLQKRADIGKINMFEEASIKVGKIVIVIYLAVSFG